MQSESDQLQQASEDGERPESNEQSPLQSAALKKLKDTWTRQPPPLVSSRRTNGRGTIATDDRKAALNIVLTNDGELENEIVAHETTANLSDVKAALIKPGGHGDDLTRA